MLAIIFVVIVVVVLSLWASGMFEGTTTVAQVVPSGVTTPVLVAPAGSLEAQKEEAAKPETFTPVVPFDYKGPYRLYAGATGYGYNQFHVKDQAKAVEECSTKCRENPECPGFALHFETGVQKFNCMHYGKNSGTGTRPDCLHEPWKEGCYGRDLLGHNGVKGGLYWRGTRLKDR